jgi:hypothetical protein
MGKMQKIAVQVGNYDGSLKNITFTGELQKTLQEFDAPNDESHGTQYDLYRVKKGYRVFERRWTNGQGENRQNYARLSDVLTEAELLEKFTLLANYAGIIETQDLDGEINENEKTVLLAVNGSGARLLPYTLANVEELIELAHFLRDQENIPGDVQAEIKGTLERFPHAVQ